MKYCPETAWALTLTFGIIGGMPSEPFVYEARYGWNRRTGLVIIGGLAFTVLAVALPGMSLAMRIFVSVFFGGGALFLLGVICTRRVAFRVDASGVTLGGMPPRYRAQTRLIPWADIEKIILWKQQLPVAPLPYVGLMRRKDAAPLASPRARRVGEITARAFAPQVSGDTLMSSRAINGWRLDTDRLIAAVAHFAPGVPVVG
jgi:hypothetical protein